VKSFRSGAYDVVLKDPEVVPYLRERVVDAATMLRSSTEQTALLQDVAEAHEDFLNKMREMSRMVTDLEDRVTGRTKTGERPAIGGGEPTDVVVVDDDPESVPRLQRVLPEKEGWRFSAALTGGEALDLVTQQRPHVVIVKEHLPDLPGSMVVKTVKSGAPDAITLLYSPPEGRGAGFVKLMEGSRVINLVPSYTAPEQLVSAMNEVREALQQKAKERRYLQAFRQRNFEFLQRYNTLKQRLAAQVEKKKG
jgi:PleD family two-component response regulator